jgi:hypothetical protein
MTVRATPPASNAEFRQALYQGDIFRLPPTPASERLVAEARTCLEHELGGEEAFRQAQFRLSDAEFFQRIGRLRKLFYTAPAFHDHVVAVVASCAFDPYRIAFDPIRLRVVTHQGFENPKAAPIYYAHRDTWYAHSQAEITWWLPLHDVTEEETFAFYPDWFARPVSNNSEAFDYEEWTRHGAALRIGWQNPNHGSARLYPGGVGVFDPGRVFSFAARRADILLFAGAHFHQTCKNRTGRTRFSLDFRIVDLEDHYHGRGAPNVDNRSTGSAVRDYIQPSHRSSDLAPSNPSATDPSNRSTAAQARANRASQTP